MPIHDWSRVDIGVFHSFHLSWVSQLCRVLNNGGLPADHYALIEQPPESVQPDVVTPEAANELTGVLNAGESPPTVRFVFRAEGEYYARKRRSIAIRQEDGDCLVALIEILSPCTKTSRRIFRELLDKAVAALRNGIHLTVIDLHPPGRHDPHGIHCALWGEICDDAFELPPDKPLTLAAYSAGLCTTGYIEPVAVGDVLPEMPLFLASDAYISLPLEATYEEAMRGTPRHLKSILEA